MCQFDSMLSRLSPTKGVNCDPRGLQCMSIFPSPHPLLSRKLKKALKLPSHRYLPTPTTFHFLPPPYIFVPISPSSLLFQAISPSTLLCTSPLSWDVILRKLRRKYQDNVHKKIIFLNFFVTVGWTLSCLHHKDSWRPWTVLIQEKTHHNCNIIYCNA